ncbi:MAG: phosphoglycerate mutase family protein [Thermoplasmata archaeon]
MKKPHGDAESSEARGEETVRNLRGIPLQSRAALFIRHSAREEGLTEDRNTSPEESWQLTPQGRVHARQFGRKIPPFAHLFLTHTRIARTRDTAEEIAAGVRETHPGSHVEMEGLDPALGLTTFYARDMALRDHWKEKLGVQFYHGWLGGQIPSNVLAPAEEAVADLVERYRTKIERSPESTLFLAVSHDVYIFAMREVLFGNRGSERPWIGYLDGVLLSWDPIGRLVARWRNETVPGVSE